MGDLLEQALAVIGVTPERVERWLGRPCGCRERKDKLNALSFLAKRVVSGRIEGAREYLEGIIEH